MILPSPDHGIAFRIFHDHYYSMVVINNLGHNLPGYYPRHASSEPAFPFPLTSERIRDYLGGIKFHLFQSFLSAKERGPVTLRLYFCSGKDPMGLSHATVAQTISGVDSSPSSPPTFSTLRLLYDCFLILRLDDSPVTFLALARDLSLQIYGLAP